MTMKASVEFARCCAEALSARCAREITTRCLPRELAKGKAVASRDAVNNATPAQERISQTSKELERYNKMLSKNYLRCKSSAIASALGLLAAVTVLQANPAFAQSTIFNIPTTDAVAPKKVYFEFDFISHLESHDNGGFQTYVPRVVVGVGKGLEVGLNVAATDSIGSTVVYAQPNIKWRFYGNDDIGVATSVGAIAYTPLKDRSANDTFGFFYGNVSKKFKGDYGPRLTFGGYGIAGLAPSG
jgi:hypothetical protein